MSGKINIVVHTRLHVTMFQLTPPLNYMHLMQQAHIYTYLSWSQQQLDCILIVHGRILLHCTLTTIKK